MSQENVEVVRRCLEAFNRGDFEASVAFLDENVEWHDPPDVPDGGVHRGPEEVRRWTAGWLAAWESYTAEAEELIDAGDRVVVVHFERGRGKGSRADVEHRVANVFDLRDGRIVRKRPFASRADALKAAGLSE
jgi:ketosteroid isomerase-like protein